MSQSLPPLAARSKELLELFAHKILVIDGAMGTMIQQRNLSAQDFGGPDLEGCNENLVLTRPDVRPRLDPGQLAQPLEPGVRACPSPEEDWGTRTRVGRHDPLEVGAHDRVHWAVERLPGLHPAVVQRPPTGTAP